MSSAGCKRCRRVLIPRLRGSNPSVRYISSGRRPGAGSPGLQRAQKLAKETLAFRIQNLKQRIETSWAQEQTCRSDCCLGACERAFHGANPLRPILQLRMRHVRNGSVSKLGHASQEVNDKDLAHIVVRIKSFQSGNAADGFDDVVRRSTERLSRVSTSSISPSVARRSMVTSGLRARIIRSMLHTTSVGQPQPIPQLNKSCPG